MTHDHLMINLGMSQDMREKKVMVMKIRAMPSKYNTVHRRRKKGYFTTCQYSLKR